MPNKNSRKEYLADSIYHVYNRGVEKRNIFIDQQDYNVFLKYLHCYFLDKDDVSGYGSRITVNVRGRAEILEYCLMPNHFHLLIKQHDERAVRELMHSLLTRYTTYFNKKYKRVGGLFQGRYKAVMVNTDEYLLHLARYILLNPEKISKNQYTSYPYSSYQYHITNITADWINTELVEGLIGGKKELLAFISDLSTDNRINESELLISNLTLDED